MVVGLGCRESLKTRAAFREEAADFTSDRPGGRSFN
jgi:hypothetical protein